MTAFAQGYRVTAEIDKEWSKETEAQTQTGGRYREIDIELQYLGVDGAVKCRELKLFTPLPAGTAKRKHPLLVALHYEIPEQNHIVREFLERGCAFMTPVLIPEEHRHNIAGDNLLFNIAAVDLAKRLSCIDKHSIMLRGGSAGGYVTLMVSSIHMGAACAYCVCGITNMVYEQKYLRTNNRFNEEHAPNLSEEERKDKFQYPVPFLKGAHDLIEATGRFLGEDDMESEEWVQHSPVSRLGEMTHPILFYHSTADLMVPLNQLTEACIRYECEQDLPAGYRDRLGDFVQKRGLDVPMADLIAPEDLEVFILTYDNPEIKFNHAKHFNLNILDEGGKSRLSGHNKKYQYILHDSELNYFDHYLGKKAHETNRLSAEKLACIANRYEGNLSLLKRQNEYKAACAPPIFGSLESDRLDVLLGIAIYLGMDPDSGSPACRQQNLETFEAYYNKLDDSLRFIDNDAMAKGMAGDAAIPQKITGLLSYYRNRCGCGQVGS